MLSLLTSAGLASALFRLGALSLVFGFKQTVCFAFAYYLLMWLIGGPNDYD